MKRSLSAALFFLLLAALCCAQQPSKGFLPANWSKLGLSNDQKQEVYKIQGQFQVMIEKKDPFARLPLHSSAFEPSAFSYAACVAIHRTGADRPCCGRPVGGDPHHGEPDVGVCRWSL